MRAGAVATLGTLGAAVVLSAAAAENRYWLASCHDWGEKRGFYLNFECRQREGEARCRLADLALILGVADGAAWRFARVDRGAWPLGVEIEARAVLGAQTAEVTLDGAPAVTIEGAFLPAAGSLTAAYVPDWAAAPAEYRITQTGLAARVDGREVLSWSSAEREPMPPGLAAFAPADPLRFPWDIPAGAAVEITARFRIDRPPALRDLAPLVDPYGQCRAAQWETRVRNDEDLRASIQDEAQRLAQMPPRMDTDPYGGWTAAGWREEGTGFFRVVRRNGFFWLISPAGNPCFYLGVNSAPALTWERTPVEGREFLFEWLPPREGPWAAAWSRNAWGSQDGDYVCLYTANLIRKYGPEAWQDRAARQAVARLQAWAFSGGGKWGAPAGMVCTPVLWRDRVPTAASHPDVFDQDVCRRFRERIAEQIAPRRRDPFVLGWSLGNEMDEVIRTGEVVRILGFGPESAAKRALVDHALETLYAGDAAALAAAWKVTAADREALHAARPEPPPRDVEALRRFYADRYYEFIYRTVKEIDPDHLYLGFWVVPGWWENEQDWFAAARHCDVVGYDRYAQTFADERLLRLMREADRPVLCGEFSFPPAYAGRRGFGRYATCVQTDAEAGEKYAEWLRAAAANPWCVGTIWFQYRDQPITGRGSGHGDELVYGEHFAFGVITETDLPKWDMVARMREANLRAAAWRQEASR